MKKDLLMKVTRARVLTNGCMFMTTEPADGSVLPAIEPGQFVNIKVPDADGVFLRRPISVCDVVNNSLMLYIKPVGKGTEKLCSMQAGDELEILLPLGRPFSVTAKKVLLIGGGVGIAPLMYLGRKLKEEGVEVRYLLGGATSSDLELAESFRSFGEVYITTVDGSAGVQGFVTDHPIFNEPLEAICACGPTPMMKAIAKSAKLRGIWMQASLENHMACGLGACLCCVEDTKEGNRCVCTDGPVFNIDELRWQ